MKNLSVVKFWNREKGFGFTEDGVYLSSKSQGAVDLCADSPVSVGTKVVYSSLVENKRTGKFAPLEWRIATADDLIRAKTRVAWEKAIAAVNDGIIVYRSWADNLCFAAGSGAGRVFKVFFREDGQLKTTTVRMGEYFFAYERSPQDIRKGMDQYRCVEPERPASFEEMSAEVRKFRLFM